MRTDYNSFEEIDQRLDILRLQKEINKEYTILHSRKLKEALIPKYWIRNWENTFQGILLSLMIRKLLKKR